MMTNIRITGEAGQGVQTIGTLLAGTFARMGLHVFSTQSYLSRIRGGVNSFDIRISSDEVFAPADKADLLVALTPDALAEHQPSLNEGGVILFDGPQSDGLIGLSLETSALEAGGVKQMANSVAAGAVVTLLGYGLQALKDELAITFRKKGYEVITANSACADKGAESVKKRKGAVRAPYVSGGARTIVSGPEAVGLSAAVSGVKVACSYPMSPSTGIFTYLASIADKYGIAVEQAEDEIAAINMVCGATYAGAPAVTTTSGGGFALMAEGLSLAGMLELPAVIIIAMRPGPATGLPTRTGQEDLMFAITAGHGEFPRFVIAPRGVHKAYAAMRRALEISHKYQSPAIVLVDQFMMDTLMTASPLPETYKPIDRCLVKKPAADYVRYAVTADGISPRTIPGGPVFVVSDSDEHTADGHITEDLETRVEQQDKRLRKNALIVQEMRPPSVYPAPAGEALLCWGSTYGPCREAVDILREAGRDVCMIHFEDVWPIDAESVAPVIAGKKITVVEGNATAQFASILRMAGVLTSFDSILKYNGMPFTAEEIAGRYSK